MYFNYGNRVPKIKDLVDTYFKAVFGGNQVILPSSIKVYEVPDELVHDNGNDIRHGLMTKLTLTIQIAKHTIKRS